MSSLEEIYSEICNLGDDDRQAVYRRFRDAAKANRNNIDAFLSNIELDENAMLFEVYEALAEESKEFEGLFVSELNRLLKIAEREPNNKNIYDTLESYAFVAANDVSDLSRALIRSLKESMSSHHAPIRRFSTWMIGDFAKQDPVGITDSLYYRLSSDSDWRVRCLASMSLKELNPGTSKYELGMLDKIRSWLFGGKINDYAA